MIKPGDLFVCNECGFEVPADNIGVALMQEHLRDHPKKDEEPDEDDV